MILRVFWSYGSKCPMVMLSAKSLDSKFWKVAKCQLICQFHKSSIHSEPHGSKRSSNSMWMLWCQSMPYHAMSWHHRSSWGKVWVFRVNWDFFLKFFGFLSEKPQSLHMAGGRVATAVNPDESSIVRLSAKRKQSINTNQTFYRKNIHSEEEEKSIIRLSAE